MLTGLDHIVVMMPTLQQAIAEYSQLGFTVVPGGKHATATENALVGFADGTYIELIAFYEPSPTHRWHQPLQNGGGLIDYCAQTNNLDADLAAFRQAGVELADRAASSRVRPDGYQLDWVLAIPSPSQQGIVPFLIEDITPRSERVPKQTAHANGVTGIDTLTIAVDDLASITAWFGQALKTTPQPIERMDLDASGYQVMIGPYNIDFLKPRNAGSPLSDWLQTRGPSPYEAQLKTSEPTTQIKQLNEYFYIQSV